MHQWKGLHEYYTMETQEFFLLKKVEIEFWLVLKSWNQPSFVNISSNISNWYINGKIFTSTTPWKPSFYASPSSGDAYSDRQLTPNFELWLEIFRVPTRFHMMIPKPCLFVRLSVPREKKSPWLRQYLSYTGNWYINGKVFTSTTAWEPKNLIFFFQKSLKFEFWLVLKSWNHLSFVNISPTIVIDTSMERSSRVLQHGNTKICFFFYQDPLYILLCSFSTQIFQIRMGSI